MKDRNPIEEMLARDLRALRDTTEQELPDPERTARVLRSRVETGEGLMTEIKRKMTGRPWITTAALGAVTALALLLVPVSYERTVGHNVTLSIRGDALDEAMVRSIAGDLETAVGGGGVRVALQDHGVTLRARSPHRDRDLVEKSTAGLASRLGADGLQAVARITPVIERVTGNVYAAARWSIVNLQVRRSGRSAADVERDLAGQLEAAGYDNPRVAVELAPDQTGIQIEAGGEDGDGARCEIKKVVRRGDGEDFEMPLRRFEYTPEPGMTDEEIREDILRELAVQGCDDAEVTVRDGKIEINVRKELER